MLESEYERTGDGYHAVIWVPKRRERMKDETRGITNEIQQGSKAVKNVKDKDLDHLKDYVKSAGSSGQSFLKLREGGAEEDVDDSSLDEDQEILAQEVAEEVSKTVGLTLALQSRICTQKRELLWMAFSPKPSQRSILARLPSIDLCSAAFLIRMMLCRNSTTLV